MLVLLNFRLRNGVEVVFLVPLAALSNSIENQVAVLIQFEFCHINILEEVCALLPAAYIPEAMTFEGEFYHTLTHIALFETIVALEFRHYDVRAGTKCVDGFVCRHAEFSLFVSITIVVVHGFCIVKVDFGQAHHNPVVACGGLIVGCSDTVAVNKLLQVVASGGCTVFWCSVETILISLNGYLLSCVYRPEVTILNYCQFKARIESFIRIFSIFFGAKR